MKVFPLLLAVASVSALATRNTREQIPLQFDGQLNVDVGAEVDYDLDWDRAPEPDATGHLIFNTVSSLLQRWPNTVVRPGMPRNELSRGFADEQVRSQHCSWNNP